MDTKLLKQKILDLAIHGKLVPQNPNDEPASKLLEKIREEKQKLIAEKKIKADKNDSYIFVGDDNRHYEKFADGTVKDIEDEIPFEVPEGWAWCRLKEIGTIITGNTPSKNEVQYYNSKDIHFYKPSDLEQGINTINSEDYVSLLGYEKSRKLPKNSILVTCIGATIGKTGLIREEGTCNQQINAILPSNIYIPELIYYWCISAYTQTKIKTASSSTTLPILNKDGFSKIVIPLPPLVEQNQIVSKIGNFFEIIDSLETDKSDLQIAIKQTKSKILDLAIHGKLVTQDESDEPASVLLERLRAEKEAKIKAGELKRDKNDSYIYKNTTDNCYYEKFNGKDPVCIDEEIPFDIPDNWQWVKLNELADIARGGSPRPIEAFITDSSEGINWIKIGDTSPESKYIISAKEKIIPEGKKHSRYVHSGDFLLTNSMSFGRPYILKIDGCIHDGWLVFGDIKESILQDYLYLALSSDYVYNAFSLVAAGSTVKNLKSETVKATLFPLPPISEQKRIVSKIEEMFERLDQIQNNLI